MSKLFIFKFMYLDGPLTPVIMNMTPFNQPSYCMDNNPQTVCTNGYGTHPFVIFDFGTPLATIPSVSVLLG
jgi:hypothetical protein